MQSSYNIVAFDITRLTLHIQEIKWPHPYPTSQRDPTEDGANSHVRKRSIATGSSEQVNMLISQYSVKDKKK